MPPNSIAAVVPRNNTEKLSWQGRGKMQMLLQVGKRGGGGGRWGSYFTKVIIFIIPKTMISFCPLSLQFFKSVILYPLNYFAYTFNNAGITWLNEKNAKNNHPIGELETKRSLRERFTDHKQATTNSCHAGASAALPTCTWQLFLRQMREIISEDFLMTSDDDRRRFPTFFPIFPKIFADFRTS